MADKDFTGAPGLSVVNCTIVKRTLPAVLGLLGFCLSMSADQPPDVSFEQLSRYRADILGASDSVALLRGLPMVCFLDEQFLPVMSEFGPAPVGSDELFPAIVVTGKQAKRLSTAYLDSKDVKDTTKTIRPAERRPLYYSGEVGAFYGHASGKVHGDAFGSYLESTVGDEHVQITVGASYDEFNGRGPRRGW
jgi:hypothetical protein